MPYNPQQDPDAHARTQVDVNDEKDLQYWTERFGVPDDVLRNAVERVGSSAEAVAKYLEKNWLP